MFKHDSALAHRACKMVAFLDCRCLFHVSMLLSVDTINSFSLANQIKFTIEAGQQLTVPFETIKLVPVTHYDVSVTSQVAKNV